MLRLALFLLFVILIAAAGSPADFARRVHALWKDVEAGARTVMARVMVPTARHDPPLVRSVGQREAREPVRAPKSVAERAAPVDIAVTGAMPQAPPPIQAEQIAPERGAEPEPDPGPAGWDYVEQQSPGHISAAADATEEIVAIPDGRLAAAVQEELARLGCYGGAIDNIWGPRSRGAMETVNRLAGTTLMVTEPSRVAFHELRRRPRGFCTDDAFAASLAAKAGRIAALPPKDDFAYPSYLPPWMRGETWVAVEEVPEEEAEPAVSEAPPVATAEQPRIRSRQAELRPRRKIRRAQRINRRGRVPDWLPDNWPGQ